MFNVFACIGWSSVNVIVGAQLFHAINHDMPGWAGILVISVATLLICTFGYRIVHSYEKFAWMACFTIFLIVLGVFASKGDFVPTQSVVTGPAKAGSILSFAAAVFGYATGWCSLAADYTVYQPASRSKVSIFLCTFVGLFVPLCFSEMLGAAVATAMSNNVAFLTAYSESHIGGLLAQVLVPTLGRFGEFCIAVLALSIIANNCPNIYSVSLSLQVFAEWTQRVPRFIWVLVGTAAYVAIAIAGYSSFEAALHNFMLMIGYWLAIYEGVALPEHFVFRRGFAGYNNAEGYDDPSALPRGYAAFAAFLIGVLGTVLGMSQTWFVGPIGKLCGGPIFGGDVGFELAFAFAAISYLALRPIEKKRFGV